MKSLRQALDASRAHQPPAWSRFAVLCGLLVLLCEGGAGTVFFHTELPSP